MKYLWIFKEKRAEKVLTFLLMFCLASQLYYIVNGRSWSLQAQRPFIDGPGGPAAPPPEGYQPGAPPRPMEPHPPAGGGHEGHIPPPPPEGHHEGHVPHVPGGPDGQGGGRDPRFDRYDSSYPSISDADQLSPRELKFLETRYNLHRWVLSDLVWGVVQLELSSEYKLNDEQLKLIYPEIKQLARSVEVIEESNKIMKGLLTDQQKEYIQAKLEDGTYMAMFLSVYSPGEHEPAHGVSDTVYKNAMEVLEDKIQGDRKSIETKEAKQSH